jgi:holo-[acyl-carrier protein] synthase
MYDFRRETYSFLKNKERRQMIKGVGTDIIEIDRVAKAIENARFLERTFAPGELAEKPAGLRAQFCAGRFAAKEAVAKALGVGFSAFWPKDIEIVNDAAGRPIVVLHAGAKKTAAELGVGAVNVSISHCKKYAVAYAVVEGNSP